MWSVVIVNIVKGLGRQIVMKIWLYIESGKCLSNYSCVCVCCACAGSPNF